MKKRMLWTCLNCISPVMAYDSRSYTIYGDNDTSTFECSARVNVEPNSKWSKLYQLFSDQWDTKICECEQVSY